MPALGRGLVACPRMRRGRSSSAMMMMAVVALTTNCLLTPLLSPVSFTIASDVGNAAATTSSEQCMEESGSSCSADDAANNVAEKSYPQLHAPNGDRLISHDELATHTTKDKRIWLSILGKVYDVTEGVDFYDATKGGYKFYAGRDASPCFATGKNTPEGAEEKIEEWETKKQLGVYEWSTFYANHERYTHIGVLAGSKYYDDNGNETQLRNAIVEPCAVAKAIQDEEREKKKAERLAARLARKEKLANKNKIW